MSEEAVVFDALAEEFFSVWFRFHPDVAAEAGIGGLERLLPAQGDDELAALGAWLETLIVAVEELDYAALDPARQIDLRLMFGAALVEHEELLERDWRHRDPLRFLPIGAIYHLALRPPENIRDILASLLGGVPEYLRLALSQLRPMAELVVPVLAAAAVEEAQRGHRYLRGLVRNPWLRRNCYRWSEIEALADQAGAALAGFGQALCEEIGRRAAGRLGCGAAHLGFLLRHRHFMGLDPARARADLAEALARCEEDLGGVCAELGLARDQAWRHLTTPGVERTRRIDLCRWESERIARFLRRAGLVSLPDVPLRISKRPAWPRPQRFGTDYVPDRRRGTATVFIGAGADEGRGEALAALRVRCQDKTWGGSHLFSFAAGEEAWRLPRRLCAKASLDGAWGLYLRERLADLGFMDADERLFAALQRRGAILRALLDLDLHLGAVADAQAVARLDGIPGADAADLVLLVRRPGDALAGVLGWRALARARSLRERREGARFSERGFHDGLLSRGPIPLPLILGAELGDELWREIAGHPSV